MLSYEATILLSYSDFQMWPEKHYSSKNRKDHTEEFQGVAIPSVELLSIINKVRFKEEAMGINVTFGYSNKLSRWFKPNCRDIFIPCTELFATPKVHGIEKPNPLIVYLHDLFHINAEGTHGHRFRELANNLGEELYKAHKLRKDQILLSYVIALIDRPIYFGSSVAKSDRAIVKLLSWTLVNGMIKSKYRPDKTYINVIHPILCSWLSKQDRSFVECFNKHCQVDIDSAADYEKRELEAR